MCEHCGTYVKGNGYTDHCPSCLWSKHVDIYPGDRKAKCNGLMEPVDLKTKNGMYTIYYKCTKCGYLFKVKSSSNDSIQAIMELTSKIAKCPRSSMD